MEDFSPNITASPEALALHADLTIWDCLSLEYILDRPYSERVLQGGVTVTNVTIATEGERWDDVLRTIETAHRRIEGNPDLLVVNSLEDVAAAKSTGRVGVVLGTQGSGAIGDQLWRLETLSRLGVRFIGLAYTGATVFADGCGERRDAGLSFLGEEFVHAVNDLPVLLDLSHTGHQSRLEAAKIADRPVLTHSNAYSVYPNDRNTRDETARIVADKGGVLGVCGLVHSVAKENQTLDHLLDHVDHWVRVAGTAGTGIGMDFTEGYQEAFRSGISVGKAPKWRVLRPDIFGTTEQFYTEKYSLGLQTIAELPNFTDGLLSRGYDQSQVRDIMGGSWMQCFAQL